MSFFLSVLISFSFFFFFFFFFNDTATTEIYTLSLHDALPICRGGCAATPRGQSQGARARTRRVGVVLPGESRSEEHTSELQSHLNLVCRLLLEKKKTRQQRSTQNSTRRQTNRSQ